MRIFDDRIEILNPGELYGNNKIENLGTDKKMEVRNNTIIRLLEETTDIVENRHTGIATMREEMENANLPEPEFEVLRGNFKVTFKKEIVPETTQKTTQKIELETLNESQFKIIKLLKGNPTLTQKQMVEITKLTREGIKYNISILKKLNIIERVGSDKKGYWKVNI